MQEKMKNAETLVELLELIDSYPEEKGALFKFIIQPENWSKLTNDPTQFFAGEIPNEEELYQFIKQPENWSQLVKGISTVKKLVEIFPEHKEELYQLVIRPNNWAQITNDPTWKRANGRLLLLLMLSAFPEKSEKFLDFLMQSGALLSYIKNDDDLKKISKIFSNSELLKNGKLEEVLEILNRLNRFNNSPAEKAYTQGAVVGLFSDRLPPEVSHYLGDFLDRNSGGKVAQVSKVCADMAHEEQERSEKLTPG